MEFKIVDINTVEINGKKVKIDNAQIDNFMKTLDITRNEAIEMYLEDEGYIINEEVEELTKKAKDNKAVDHKATAEKPRAKRNVEPKQNPDKEFLVDIIYQLLAETEHTEQVNITNKTKLIEFIYKGKAFKLDLVEKRVKKEKSC